MRVSGAGWAAGCCRRPNRGGLLSWGSRGKCGVTAMVVVRVIVSVRALAGAEKSFSGW